MINYLWLEDSADLYSDLRPVHLRHAVVKKYDFVHACFTSVDQFYASLNLIQSLSAIERRVTLDLTMQEHRSEYLDIHLIIVNDKH